MTRRIGKFLFHSTFSALALALGLLLFACSGGTNYVGTGTTQAPAATESYTVTFETNGGSAVTKQVVASGEKASEPSAPAKTRATFGGWYTDSGLTGAFDFNTAITGNTTLYAKWTYSVTVDSSITGGTVASDKTSDISAGSTVTLTITPETNRWLGKLTVKDSEDTAVSTTETTEGTVYTLTMPDSSVTVSAVFSPIATGSSVLIKGRCLDSFNIIAEDHEVTQGEYEAYCKYGGTDTPSSFYGIYGVGTSYPAYFVSWYDALVYCNKRSMDEGKTPCYKINGSTNPASWPEVVDDGAGKHCGPSSPNTDWDAATCDFTANGYRLPTEAEWEWLARGGDPTAAAWSYTYSGSNTIDDVAWYDSNSGTKTHEVKGKSANSKGLYDMSGNVSEWCWDRYGTITATTPAAGAAYGASCVYRGGSWRDVGSCAVSFRAGYAPSVRYHFLGFRVVRTAQ
ncbi:MAG: SUMF1/EgtB/PvdO family nonheme iron enzyme [Treponema sp.]|nr:SUMF1/EgtB/PvdO family nonheme iron enzyme [Treponema sp.]